MKNDNSQKKKKSGVGKLGPAKKLVVCKLSLGEKKVVG